MGTYKSPVTGMETPDYLDDWLDSLTEVEFDAIYKGQSEEEESESRRKGKNYSIEKANH